MDTKKATRGELLRAFMEILDGNSSWWDIQNATGLPEDRCKEISVLFDRAFAEVYKK